MPNKFSHSVVLAHYHSLGLIDLSNSQYFAQLNSSLPASLWTPGAPSKTQSARNRTSDNKDIDESTRQRSDPARASQVFTPVKLADSQQTSKRRLIIDTDDVSKHEPTAVQSSLQEKAPSTSTSRTNSRSTQRNSKQYSIQPAQASKSDSRDVVNGEWASQAIRTEGLASLKTSAAPHSNAVHERWRNAPQPVAGRPADADRYKHGPKSPSRNLQPTHPTQASQATKKPPMRSSSPVRSTTAEPQSADMYSLAARPSRPALAYPNESRISNPLPEVADFDDFEDVDETEESERIAIYKSTWKAGSSVQSKLPPEAELAPPQTGGSNFWPGRSSSITGPQAATSEPASPYIQDLSGYSSLESLSSLSSVNIPVVERAHPLRQDKRVASRTIRPSGTSSHVSTSNGGKEASYSSSSAEYRSSSQHDSGARQLEHVHRALVQRQPVNRDRAREVHAARLVEAGTNSTSDLAMYGLRNAVESPLAQVEKMLQQREDESNTREGVVNNGIGLRREEKIREAEKRLTELKKNTAVSGMTVDSHKEAAAKMKRREAGGFFHRLREQL